MPRPSTPQLSPEAEQVIATFRQYLAEEQDLSPKTLRNYESDLRHFAAWYESTWGDDTAETFSPAAVATPILTRYRSHLQTVLHLKPATINRHLITLKRFFEWATDRGLVERDPAKVVKLVPEVEQPPRQLTDQEEAALVAAVERHGSLRDKAILITLLHTGLRAMELCNLAPGDIVLGKRSGTLQVRAGKRNKHREVPLNATVRSVLEEYVKTLPPSARHLFPSEKTGQRLTERALRHLVAKYADLAKLKDVSPHDLRHRFGYRMAESTPLHRLAQIMGHDSLDTTMIYVKATKADLQGEVEKIAWQ